MGDRTMKIVIGYVPGVDRLPKDVRALGFDRRVAFVLDTFRADKVDMFFDTELYAALLDAVREASRANRLSVVSSSGKTLDLPNGYAVVGLLERNAESMREPLFRVIMNRDGTPVSAVDLEPWAHIGGPRPYHDSYTMAVYSRDDLAERLEGAARAVCRRLGAEVTELVRASDIPSLGPILLRIKKRLGLG